MHINRTVHQQTAVSITCTYTYNGFCDSVGDCNLFLLFVSVCLSVCLVLHFSQPCFNAEAFTLINTEVWSTIEAYWTST